MQSHSDARTAGNSAAALDLSGYDETVENEHNTQGSKHKSHAEEDDAQSEEEVAASESDMPDEQAMLEAAYQ